MVSVVKRVVFVTKRVMSVTTPSLAGIRGQPEAGLELQKTWGSGVNVLTSPVLSSIIAYRFSSPSAADDFSNFHGDSSLSARERKHLKAPPPPKLTSPYFLYSGSCSSGHENRGDETLSEIRVCNKAAYVGQAHSAFGELHTCAPKSSYAAWGGTYWTNLWV
jgi:hypothetical protein